MKKGKTNNSKKNKNEKSIVILIVFERTIKMKL